MGSIAPRPCAFSFSRARSSRSLRIRSPLTRCCQSSPAIPKFAISVSSLCCVNGPHENRRSAPVIPVDIDLFGFYPGILHHVHEALVLRFPDCPESSGDLLITTRLPTLPEGKGARPERRERR